jgi:hypothetical protein
MVGVDVVYKSLAFRKAVYAPLKGNQCFLFRAPFSKVCTRTEVQRFLKSDTVMTTIQPIPNLNERTRQVRGKIEKMKELWEMTKPGGLVRDRVYDMC